MHSSRLYHVSKAQGICPHRASVKHAPTLTGLTWAFATLCQLMSIMDLHEVV